MLYWLSAVWSVLYLFYWLSAVWSVLYLLYWLSGAHFTCFTGTKVQILTQNVAANTWHSDGSGCSYVGGTHFSLLYLLYWYKSTSTDAESAFFCPPGRLFAVCADAVAC